MVLFGFGRVSIRIVVEIRWILNNCNLRRQFILNATLINRDQSRVDPTQRLVLELALIRRVLWKLEINESFAVELTRIDALLTSADVNILVFEVEPGDVVYFFSDGLLLGAGVERTGAEGKGASWVRGVGNAAEHRYNFIICLLLVD
jgi:hypothetical protein